MKNFPLLAALALFAPGVSAAPTSAPPPARVEVTLTVIQVPDAVNVDAVNVDLGPNSASGVYTDMMVNHAAEATEISLVTPTDFPGTAQYSRTFVYTTVEHGKPQKNFYAAPTRLEATPHVNTDGTITVRLTTQATLILPANLKVEAAGPPLTQNRGLITTRTFRSGQMIVFGDTVRDVLGHAAGGTDTEQQILQFVQVRLLQAVPAKSDQAQAFPGGPASR